MFESLKRKSNKEKVGFVEDNVKFMKKVMSVDEIKANAGLIKSMANAIKPSKSNRVETFQEAVIRLNVSDEDLKANYRNNAVSFYVSFTFALVCLGGLFINLFQTHNTLASLSMASIMLLCLSNCFRFSFRALQIKHQNLFSPKEWLNRKKEWFPIL